MELNQVKKFIELNSPHLFLGAGFNHGLIKDGQEIALGEKLKSELIDYLESNGIHDDWKDFHLQDVIETFSDELGAQALSFWLTDRFSHYYPSEMQKVLTNFHWKKIYTTNIDDILEKIYEVNKIPFVLQNTKLKKRNTKNYTEIIKLHGCIRNPAEGFLFSKSDYLINHLLDCRFAFLSQDIIAEPFIIVGSQFDEDHILSMIRKILDTNKILKVQNKTFIISPNLSPRLMRGIQKINAEWIKGTTTDFLNILSDINISPFKRLDLNLKYSGFININKIISKPKIDNKPSKLYWGDQPNWDDMINNIDVVDEEKIKLFQNEIRGKCRHIVLMGNRCSGKTTLLKRLGYFLTQEGFSVWEYADDIFSWSSWCYYINREPEFKKVALLIDDASRLYHDINRLFKAIDENTQLIIISTSSNFMHYKKKYALIEDYLSEIFISKPSELQINAIYLKLVSVGLLGELRKIEIEEERIKKLSNYPDLSSLFFSITYGDEFKNRFRSIFRENISNITNKSVLQILYMFDVLDIPYLPNDLLLHFFNQGDNKDIKSFEDIVRKKDKKGYSLRNRFFHDLILDTLNGDVALQHIEKVIMYIAPFIDEKEESIYKEIFTMLIRPKRVNKILGIDLLKYIKMLHRIRHLYDWSYNYWLQLGIAEQMRNEYEIALNHLKQAEAISPNSYMVHNAIGRNFLKKAINISGYLEAKPFIDEGESILMELIYSRDTQGAKGYSIHTLITEYIKIAFKFNIEIPKVKFDIFKELVENQLTRAKDDPMVNHLAKLVNRYELKFLRKKFAWNELDIVKELISEDEIDDILDLE